MYSSIPNSLAAVAVAFIVMASNHYCAGQQASSGHSERTAITSPLQASSAQWQRATANRLGSDSLSDLRSNQMVANGGDTPTTPRLQARQPQARQLQARRPQVLPQPVPESPAANLLSRLKQPSAASQLADRRTQNFFGSDQPPPVVVVWMNSDLETSLLSEGQLKQWMYSIREHDNRTNNAQANAWQGDVESHVDLASFQEPVPASRGFAGATEKIEAFRKRLTDIEARLESKHAQVAAGEVGDQVNKSELNNLLSIVSEWDSRASAGFRKAEC